MNASTSPDMIQFATDCSRYWIDLWGRKAREGSGYSRRAETPIRSGSMKPMISPMPFGAASGPIVPQGATLRGPAGTAHTAPSSRRNGGRKNKIPPAWGGGRPGAHIPPPAPVYALHSRPDKQLETGEAHVIPMEHPEAARCDLARRRAAHAIRRPGE